MKSIISIVGTTGIGKTKLAIALAEHFGTEIISCDSRQFFKEMPIGTAAPSPEELEKIPHHFILNRSVTELYSIGQYELDAIEKINQLFEKYDKIILVGGSMMYEKAVIEGLHPLPESNAENQKKLQEILENQGIESLQEILKNLDPIHYHRIDSQNPRRLLRAIDVIWQTEKKYSEILSISKEKRNFKTIRIGIQAPRETIYENINQRVDLMIKNGLLQEVENLLPYRDLPSLKTVGYTEIFNFFDKKWDLDFAISEIKKNSRRFAKRQLTWYRGEENIFWVNYQNSLKESLSLLKNF